MSVDLSPPVAVPPETPSLVPNPKCVEPKSFQTLAALQEKPREETNGYKDTTNPRKECKLQIREESCETSPQR